MEFGICLASRPQDLDYVVEAERLGYTHCWAGDSQMIWSDAYAVLALVAERTATMKLGPGVAVAATRPAPVTAAALATINQLAPGRVFCGIGTGHTAMRTMGLKPMPVTEFDDYLAALRPLLRGEEVELTFRGETAPVRHLMPDDGFVRFDPPVPIFVSAFGPKAFAVAARHGDGLISSVPPDPDAVRGLRQLITGTGAEAGRTLTRVDFPVASLTTMLVLEPGETLDSERVRRQTGAFAIANLHYAYEQVTQFGHEPPAHLADIWDDYVAVVERTPIERRHQRIHQGHNCWVIPEEEPFVTAELIARTCLVGTAGELVDRVGALDEAGLDQLVLLPPLHEKEAVIRSIAADVLPAFGPRP
jgi:alkanesulfonate monooxygenase SsuD/methylene tetrahydromethanopterin reductase-like flavin-dependent oxidoreductase (luciferase family)